MVNRVVLEGMAEDVLAQPGLAPVVDTAQAMQSPEYANSWPPPQAASHWLVREDIDGETRWTSQLRKGLNQSLKGKTYKELTFEVERDRVTQFALAVGEDDPRFLEAGAAQAEGFPEQLAFPTFPTVIGILVSAQAVTDPELGLDYSRVVHGEQAYEWKRPLVVGDVLKTTPRIGDIYTKGPNEFLVIEAEMTDADGEVVCVSRGTLLSRGTAEGA